MEHEANDLNQYINLVMLTNWFVVGMVFFDREGVYILFQAGLVLKNAKSRRAWRPLATTNFQSKWVADSETSIPVYFPSPRNNLQGQTGWAFPETVNILGLGGARQNALPS